MGYKKYILRFRAADRDIFSAIRNGKKKVETRAGSTNYQSITKGDTVLFVCSKSKFRKRVHAVRKFRSIRAMLKKYQPEEIHPQHHTASELEKLYHSFPHYREKLKKYGLIAMELE